MAVIWDWLWNERVKIAYVLLAFGIVLGGYFKWDADKRIERVARETHVALCAFKLGLERRYEDGTQFLSEHPNGIPGISAADIQRSLANQLSTLESLASLDCS